MESDTDSAPAYGGAVGFGFEGMTGREYELLTNGGDGYISEVTAWTFMPNLWIDVPLHQWIAWMFGRIPPSEDRFGRFTMDLAAHALNFGVRVSFDSIPYPEKWAIRRDAG